ncbi:nuclear transport factor 2 family protein [Flavobacterium humi]|uniref:Nuclear transport factor 2 family protein n=1 Tax=Flavobacterium humi TaxID=2562683 RepID=A0A4Z0L5W9_9FLAO|nr:nuclear transport factor 2 family protein [Flavobacterium humi]TGD57916.1 nuclear transport factor 2 family protein [Flavobacterium humi]
METNLLNVKKQITEVENRLLAAIKSSDVKALDTLLHDDLLFITPDGQVLTKAMDLASHASGNMVIDYIVSVVDMVNIIEDTAVAIVTIETKGKMLNQPIEGKFKYVRVWRLSENHWKVIAGSCMAL